MTDRIRAHNRFMQGFASGIAAAFLLTIPLTTGAAQAQERFVDFEQFNPGRSFTGVQPPLVIDEVTISGGQLITGAHRFNRSDVYAASHKCSGCAKTITLTFSKPVSDVSFDLLNGRNSYVWFEIEDDTTHRTTLRLALWKRAGSKTTVDWPTSGIRKIVIGQTVDPKNRWWKYYIDNLRYTVDSGQEYTVSFSAFVPHDNVPGGPTASCLLKDPLALGSTMPPGLNRLGKYPSNKARWARAGYFPGNQGRGVPSTGEIPGVKRKLYFSGDNRGFDPDAENFRLRQRVTLIPDEMDDPDGVHEDGVSNEAGEVSAFAEDAMADGVIGDGDEDGISDDCILFHKAHRAETDLMDVTVTRTGPKSLQARFKGTLDSPLVGPAEVLGAIDWDFTLTLDITTEPGIWTLSGAHDGFPAYEIYVNGAPLYRHDPGTPPYEFAKDTRKLLPPLDIGIAEISGELP